MQQRKTTQTILLFGIFLTGCSSLGDNFFIQNYEEQPIQIEYSYYTYDNGTNTTDFAYPPKNYVLMSDTMVTKKVIRQFPYKSWLYFDTLAVSMIDSLTYQVEMPANSSLRIAPVYYGDNIAYVRIDETDTIQFSPEYPKVRNVALKTEKVVVFKPRLVGDTYYILNVRKHRKVLEEYE
jgi:hypothetical protein